MTDLFYATDMDVAFAADGPGRKAVYGSEKPDVFSSTDGAGRVRGSGSPDLASVAYGPGGRNVAAGAWIFPHPSLEISQIGSIAAVDLSYSGCPPPLVASRE